MPITAAATVAGHPLWHYAGVLVAPLLMALVFQRTASLSRWLDGPAQWWRAVRRAPRPLQAVAAGSAGTAVIHFSVCPEHFQETALYGVFFLALASTQLGWALLVAARPSRRLLVLGAAANVATVALWVVSRTSGVPFGPEAWEVETVGRLDVAASAIELAGAATALYLARTLPRRVPGGRRDLTGQLHRFRALLPQGDPLPDDVWGQRHRWILGVLWAHIPAIVVFAAFRGRSWLACLVCGALIVPFGVVGRRARARRRLATVATAVGLLSCSAVLVYLSGGSIEMHFHYFVMVGLITLYQDWWPFLVAIGYVVLQHGVAGVLDPRAVFDEAADISHPWEWASIHGLFVLGMSATGMASWRLNEAFMHSVTERQADLEVAQEDLQTTLSLLSATLDATADGILVVNRDGRITSFNRRFVELWGLPEDVLVARDDQRALSYVLEQLSDPGAFMAKVEALYAEPDAHSQDILAFKDGRTFERSSTPQRVGGQVVGRVWSFRDVTAQHRLQQELSHQAFHDSLTDLANQALFRDRAGHALARAARAGGALAVLFVDLDDFKTVNDSLGHTAGDDLLVAVARRVQACVRATDTAARLGGDEFAILMEDLTKEEEARLLAARLIDALRRPFDTAGREVVVRASVGIAFGGADTTVDQLLRNADLAMYTAKRRRNGSYEVYQSDMHAKAVERLELEADLRRGLSRDELVVMYQPIVTADRHRVVGVEALVRWQHPTRGLLAPLSFIPLAEHTGLINELGAQVLEVACAQTRRWQVNHPEVADLTVSVNLSPRQLYQDGIVDQVRAALDRSGLAPYCLTLEITETAMMGDPDTAISRLRQLKELGVRLAVDDFGTGYSSLSYLERFPVDILKIDRTFVESIDPAAVDSSLASAIISLARTLSLHAVAEGVETNLQARILAGMGCDYAQGYYFARPADAATVEALLGTVVGGVVPPGVDGPERAASVPVGAAPA